MIYYTVGIVCWLNVLHRTVFTIFGQHEKGEKKMQHRDGKVQSIRAGALCIDGHAQRTHTDIK